jgi:uncharacterized HAD superfamily protein
MMNIAFDADDTLFNNDLTNKYLTAQGYDAHEVLRSFHIRNLKIKDDEKKHIHTLFNNKAMNKLKPNPNAKHVVETFARYKTNEIFVITARGENVKDGTIKMVKKHFPVIKPYNIHFTAGGSKEELLRELEIDIFVEDNIEAVLELAPKMPEIMFFVLSYEETPHNHDTIASMKPMHNVQIVSNLKDILL